MKKNVEKFVTLIGDIQCFVDKSNMNLVTDHLQSQVFVPNLNHRDVMEPVDIDIMIANTIFLLNQKGYYTKESCSGHLLLAKYKDECGIQYYKYEDEEKDPDLNTGASPYTVAYISFKKDYDPKLFNIPEYPEKFNPVENNGKIFYRRKVLSEIATKKEKKEYEDRHDGWTQIIGVIRKNRKDLRIFHDKLYAWANSLPDCKLK